MWLRCYKTSIFWILNTKIGENFWSVEERSSFLLCFLGHLYVYLKKQRQHGDSLLDSVEFEPGRRHFACRFGLVQKTCLGALKITNFELFFRLFLRASPVPRWNMGTPGGLRGLKQPKSPPGVSLQQNKRVRGLVLRLDDKSERRENPSTTREHRER